MKKVILAILTFTPVFAFAALEEVDAVVEALGEIVTTAIPIVFGIIVITFFWGLARFIFAQGNEEAKAEGKKIMLWGLIAIFIAASVWGIVAFARSALGVADTSSITIPTVI